MSEGLAWNGDKGDLDSPDERVVSCGLRVDRLQAQLDRIEALLMIANKLIILPADETRVEQSLVDSHKSLVERIGRKA